MATWKKVLHESSPASDFPTLNQATTGNAGTVTNGVYTTLVSSATLGWVIDEDGMGTDSATKVPTQQSVKAYVDAQVDTADAISELADTTIAGTIANNEVLAWDGSSAWINQTAVEAGLQPNDSALTQLATYVPQEVTRGIGDGNLARIDHDDVADDDYARFTANGLEGRSPAEVLSDIGAQAAGTYYTDSANATYWTADADRNFGNVGNTVTAKGSITVDQNLTVTGDLTITGDIDSYNVTVLDVADQTIKLNAGQTGTPSLDAQIVAERGDSTDAKLYWDESATTWKMHDGTLSGSIVSVKSSTATDAPTAAQTGVGSLYVADTDGTPVVYIRVT